MKPYDAEPKELFAWVGEDEYGSGVVGLKQGITPAGVIPLVAIKRAKIDTPELREAMARQARAFSKTIRLVRFVPVEDMQVIDWR